jgi:protoporphyrinogen oxidase
MLQKAPVDRLRIVEKIWHEFLGDDMVLRPRFSRIYNNGRYFKYPLEPFDALSKLGLWESAACGMSFPNSLLLPQRPELTFDAWVSNRFGKRLFRTWGIPCSQIDASWAAQRISGLSGLSLLKSMLLPEPRAKGTVIKTLIHSFQYPRQGRGMMWEECARRIE